MNTAGDGEMYTLSGNVGLPLGETGFANLSAEYGASQPTDRSVQRDDAALLTSMGNTNVRNPAQIWGTPEIEDDLKLWGNFGYLFNDRVMAYGHTNYASKKVTGGFYFRNPNTRGAVFSGDGGQTLLIGDALDAIDGVLDGSANCPVVTVTNGVPDQAVLAQIFADPNCFSFQERFPGGFTPNFGGDVEDMSFVGGLRGEFSSGLSWDASASYGSNLADFFIFNTVNASLGPETPTSFKPGFYHQEEMNLNLDFSYAASDRVNLAGGTEYRDERFEIGRGDLASYQIGRYAPQGFSSSSNGFPGFSDIASGTWSRSNYALYGDVELRDEKGWTLAGTLRFEDFEGFGSTLNGKVAGRVGLTDALGLRGSLSTGFRAPTPGQQNAFNVSTIFSISRSDLINNGTVPSTSKAARLRGGGPLTPEKSLNLALGTVLNGGEFRFSVDVFQIGVFDRLSLTQNFELTNAEVEQLLSEGITSARNLAEFRFFTNNFETRTRGIDLVVTYEPLAFGGNTTFSLVLNRTSTTVTDHDGEALSEARIRLLQEGLPRDRANLSVHQTLQDNGLRLLGRASYFGGWYDDEDGRDYPGAAVIDVEAAYSLNDALTLAVGGQNALNNYPEENPRAEAGVGNRYSQFTPFGFNGGFYYARLSYSWR